MIASQSPDMNRFLVVYFQQSIMGQILLNKFVNDMDDGSECILRKYAGDRKMERVVHASDSCTAIQRNLDWLEKQANRKLTKQTNNGNVLLLEYNEHTQKDRLGTGQLENSFAEWDVGIPAGLT